MKIIASLALLCLMGCAGGSPFTDASQNWNFQATSEVYPGFTFDMGGVLDSGAGTFELLHTSNVTNGLCFTAFPEQVTPITVNGSIATSLVSQPQNGQVFTFTGTAYSVTGTCGTDHGTLTANLMFPIAGTYTGTLKDGSSLQLTVTQSAAADSQGIFHLSGTRTVAGGACGSSKTAAIADSNADTWLVGNQFLAVFSQGNVKIQISGSFNQSASVLDVSDGTYGPDCQNLTSGTLQK